MGVLISPESELGKELAKWEQRNYNPHDPKNRYPMMLYKAKKRPDGVLSTGEGPSMDATFGGPGAAENWSKQCQRIVENENEHAAAREDGWRDNREEAVEYVKYLDKLVADAAAHRAFEDRNMSERAKAEAQAAEDATSEHLAEVLEQPRRRLGRPPKQQPAA